MRLNPFYLAGRVFQRLGNELLFHGGMQGTWIDVGAHEGEATLNYARHNPGLRVYAVEPNLRVVARLVGQVPNFIVVPVAIAESDGCAEFNINAFEMGSSLLPLNEEGLRSWVGVGSLRVESVVSVPTVRLDTLMGLLRIQKVDFLKIDTQGSDLAVLRSAGDRLRDVARITLEVEVAPVPLYKGAPSKGEVLKFLTEAGFVLAGAEKQTHDQEENLTFVRVRGSRAMA